MTLTQMKQEKYALLHDNSKMLDKIDKEGRDITKKEELEFQNRIARIDELNDLMEVKKAELIEAAENDEGWSSLQDFGKKINNRTQSTQKGVQTWEAVSGDQKGKKVRVIPSNLSLSKSLNIKNDSDLNWRDYLKERIQGYTGSTRAMSTSADSTLVPEPLSAQVIDLARNKSRIFQAGALTVPMSSKTLTIARITGDPTASWKAENASHTASDVSTEPLTFTAQTLVSSVKMSVELSEDAPNASYVIANSLANSLALELDRVGLLGSGTAPEPQGIFGASEVQSVDMGTDGAAISDYTPFSNAYTKILEANGEPKSAIFAPRTFKAIDQLTATDGQPLTPPMSYQELQKLVTNQVPIDQDHGTATNASCAFVGDFSNLLVGVRTQLRIEVSREASDSTNSAWEDLQVWVRAYLRADIQLAHPDQFCVIEGIIPAS